MGLIHSTQDGIITITAKGAFNVEQIRTTFSEIRAACEDRAVARILILEQGSRFDPSQADVEEIVQILTALFDDRAVRIALVARKGLHFGLGRMVCAHASMNNLPFTTYRDRAKAQDWLQQA
ncbi:MAG: hypothetical protein ACE5HU_04645 [Acidobacteriota bacterium]